MRLTLYSIEYWRNVFVHSFISRADYQALHWSLREFLPRLITVKEKKERKRDERENKFACAYDVHACVDIINNIK